MLIAPAIKPVDHGCPSYFETFGVLAGKSDLIRISAGYVSISSLLLLERNIREGKLPAIELTIGMHAFSGFTKPQYEAARTLASTLEDEGLGEVLICTAFPYHGKLYSFFSKGSPHRALIGSSNLSRLDPDGERVFELDVAIDDPGLLAEIEKVQTEINTKAARSILDWEPDSFTQTKNLMVDIPDAEHVSDQEKDTVFASRTGIRFELPLKNEARSNLNVYFGRGRLNSKTGLIRPRPWYEVEVIVSKSITSQRGYPEYEAFDVVTDDGWKFRCETNGDYSKNFRSSGGLTVLGSWIKGRLEAHSVIKVGERITEEHLAEYGCHHLTLEETDDPDVWCLSFNPER